jgi:hypothetical protein
MHWFFDSAVAAYILCIVIFLYAIILRLRCGAWSNPSVAFALFWGSMILMPVFFVPEIRPSAYAIGYITAAVFAFGLPVLAFDWRRSQTNLIVRSTGSMFLSRNQALCLLFILQLIVLTCMMANVAYQGFSINDFLTDPFAIGCEYLGYRYRGDAKPFALAQAAIILNYVAAALAGLIVAHRRSFVLGGFTVALCILPSLYSIAIYGDKGTIFLVIAFFYGAVVVGRIRNGNTALWTLRSILSAPLILSIVAAAIGFAMFNRISGSCEGGQTSKLASQMTLSVVPGPEANAAVKANDGKVKFYIRSYAFGHLFAFSSWFDHRIAGGVTLPDHTDPNPRFSPQWNTPDISPRYSNPERPTYGFWTFMAVGKYLNPAYFTALPDGYYEEYFLWPGIVQTNIYTFFRGLINDFTIPGSLGVLLLAGFFFNAIYRRILQTPYAPLSETLYIFFAGYLYTSYIISLLIWSSVIASAIGTYVMLAFIGYFDRHGGSITSIFSRRYLRSAGREVESETSV